MDRRATFRPVQLLRDSPIIIPWSGPRSVHLRISASPNRRGRPLAVSYSLLRILYNHSLLVMSSPGSPGKPMLHPHTSLCTSSGSFKRSDRLNTPDTSSVDVATVAAAEAPTTPTGAADTACRTGHPEEHLDQDLPLSPGVRQNVKETCADLHFSDLVKANGELCAYTIISQIDEKGSIEDGLRKEQLQAIFDLPDEPLTPWGEDIDEVVENGDMYVGWLHVGFHVNDNPQT